VLSELRTPNRQIRNGLKRILGCLCRIFGEKTLETRKRIRTYSLAPFAKDIILPTSAKLFFDNTKNAGQAAGDCRDGIGIYAQIHGAQDGFAIVGCLIVHRQFIFL